MFSVVAKFTFTSIHFEPMRAAVLDSTHSRVNLKFKMKSVLNILFRDWYSLDFDMYYYILVGCQIKLCVKIV